MKLNHNFKEWVTYDAVLGLMLNAAFRFLVAWGGRGGGKSHFVAELLVIIGTQRKTRILCIREFQNSIDDSVMQLLMDKANKLCPNFYTQKNGKIIGLNGTTFVFKGLARNIGGVKSLEGFDITWVEEGQYISAKGWEILEPTIRKENSAIIITMNREAEQAILDKKFLQSEKEDLPPRTIITKVNYYDNPYDIPILIESAEHCKKVDYQTYTHIWEGGLNNISKAQVLHGKWRVATFETPKDAIFYHGADWSNGGSDPHTLDRSFILDNKLYIDWEMETNLDFQFLPELWEQCPSLEAHTAQGWTVYGDDARYDLIRMQKAEGYNVQGAPKKWAGVASSVQAGITYFRGFDEIVIHERCVNTIQNATNWKYKIDERSGDVTPILEKGNDHHFAGHRYAHVKNIINTSKRKR